MNLPDAMLILPIDGRWRHSQTLVSNVAPMSKKLTAYIDFNLNSQNYQKIIGNILEHLIPSHIIGIKLWIVFTDEITLHAIVKIQNKSKVKKNDIQLTIDNYTLYIILVKYLYYYSDQNIRDNEEFSYNINHLESVSKLYNSMPPYYNFIMNRIAALKASNDILYKNMLYKNFQ